jgi:hypothetical protein
VHEWLPTTGLKEVSAHATHEPPSDVCPATHTQSVAAVALTLSRVVLFGGHSPHATCPDGGARKKLPEGHLRQLSSKACTRGDISDISDTSDRIDNSDIIDNNDNNDHSPTTTRTHNT